MKRAPEQQARVAALVAQALDHYAAGLRAAALDEVEQAAALAPDDIGIVAMRNWLRAPTEDEPLYSVEPMKSNDEGVSTSDPFGQKPVPSLKAPSPLVPTEVEPVPQSDLALSPSALQALVESADDGMAGFGKPQLTPVPTLLPMQPEVGPKGDEVRGKGYEVEMVAEPTSPRHKSQPNLSVQSSAPTFPSVQTPPMHLPLPQREAAPQPIPDERSTVLRELRTTPSQLTARPAGTLLGVMPSYLGGPTDSPSGSGERPAFEPRQEQKTPTRPTHETMRRGTPPAGTQMLHRVAPEDISTMKARHSSSGSIKPRRTTSPGAHGSSSSVPAQTGGQRSPSGRRTNPYVRRSPEDVMQALDDLRLAVEAGAALEAFELAERAMEILAGMPIDAEQQKLLVEAYELAIGPLDQPVRHGTVPAALDPRIAFLLSRIDGLTSVDELLEISGMPRFEAVRLLAQLVRQGVVEF